MDTKIAGFESFQKVFQQYQGLMSRILPRTQTGQKCAESALSRTRMRPAPRIEGISQNGCAGFKGIKSEDDKAGFSSGLGLKWQWKRSIFVQDTDISYSYGYTSGREDRNRTDIHLSLGVPIRPRLQLAFRSDILLDRHAGYERRAFLGVEALYSPMLDKRLEWDLLASMGVIIQQEVGGVLLEEFSILGGSSLIWTPNDRFQLAFDSEANYATSSTLVTAGIRLDFPIMGRLKLGLDADGSYDTSPPADTKSWDFRFGAVLSYRF